LGGGEAARFGASALGNPSGPRERTADDREGRQTIEAQVPSGTAYHQWTQFEEFPRLMEGVEEVRQPDDRRLHWVAEFGGERHEWDAEIVEHHPEERVAWRNIAGKDNAALVTVHKIRETGAWRGDVPREG